jgi:hypothetical protein
MSAARPNRRGGISKEGKAGTVSLLPVTSSSSFVPSGKLGKLLAAPDRKYKEDIMQLLPESFLHVRQEF